MIQMGVLQISVKGASIHPANPNASVNTRKVLAYLYDLPKRSESRLISGQTIYLGGA